MHPVEWHLRNPSEVREERRRLEEEKLKLLEKPLIVKRFKDSEAGGRRSTIHGTQSLVHQSRWSSLGNLKENNQHASSLLIEALKVNLTIYSSFIFLYSLNNQLTIFYKGKIVCCFFFFLLLLVLLLNLTRDKCKI